jgi:hypothetical protein
MKPKYPVVLCSPGFASDISRTWTELREGAQTAPPAGLNYRNFSADFLRIGKVSRINIAEFARQNSLNGVDGTVRRNS